MEMIEVLTSLHEIVLKLPKLQDDSCVIKHTDKKIENDFSTDSEIKYSFSVNRPEYRLHNEKQVDFVLSKSTFTPVLAAVQTLCIFSVVFGTEWYYNGISKCYNQLSLNNIPDNSKYYMKSGTKMIGISPEQITEEWMFQLLSLHDIPYYEEMVEYDNIRTTMKSLPFKISFHLSYQEQYCSMFLEQIKGYLDDT